MGPRPCSPSFPASAGHHSGASQVNIVYRVQDSHGRGPYKPGFSQTWVEDRPDLDNLLPYFIEMPNVLSGRPRLDPSHIGCACKTIEQLERWITKSEYLTLRQYGYQAMRLVVDEILGESETQCVFERKRGTCHMDPSCADMPIRFHGEF